VPEVAQRPPPGGFVLTGNPEVIEHAWVSRQIGQVILDHFHLDGNGVYQVLAD